MKFLVTIFCSHSKVNKTNLQQNDHPTKSFEEPHNILNRLYNGMSNSLKCNDQIIIF